MITKQKAVFATILFGLILGFQVVFSGGVAVAQQSQPSDCEPGPHFDACVKEEEAREKCKDKTGEELQACIDNEVSGTTPEPEDRLACKPGEANCCGGVKTSIIGGVLCGDDVNNPSAQSSSIYRLLLGVLRLLTAGVGIAAVGGIAYGALLYTTAENKPDQTKRAIGIITNVVIGIVAYALMYLLLNFLIPGGIFS